MTALRDFLIVLGKDLRIEVRRLDGIASMVFLSAVVALVLALAMGQERETAQTVGPGVLWVAILLSATIGLGRLLERERRFGGFQGLLLSPLNRSALFLGKASALLVLLLVTELALAPLCALLFHLPLGDHLPRVALLLLLGSSGYALVGTLLGAIALKANTGELLLGAIIYPLVVPLLIGGVKGTAVVLQGGDWAMLQPWVALLLLSDAVFLVAGLWLFESLATD